MLVIEPEKNKMSDSLKQQSMRGIIWSFLESQQHSGSPICGIAGDGAVVLVWAWTSE